MAAKISREVKNGLLLPLFKLKMKDKNFITLKSKVFLCSNIAFLP